MNPSLLALLALLLFATACGSAAAQTGSNLSTPTLVYEVVESPKSGKFEVTVPGLDPSKVRAISLCGLFPASGIRTHPIYDCVRLGALHIVPVDGGPPKIVGDVSHENLPPPLRILLIREM